MYTCTHAHTYIYTYTYPCRSMHTYTRPDPAPRPLIRRATLPQPWPQAYLEVRGTYNWLHSRSYNPLISPLSRVSWVMIGL